MKEGKKVYCKDCGRYDGADYCYLLTKEINFVTGNKIIERWDCGKKNEIGDCKDYQRKWWKFWEVKE